jgi:tripeptide aminopeptidase
MEAAEPGPADVAVLRPPRASAEEREWMLDLFVRLCETESPSRRERRCADMVRRELTAMGLEAEEDASGAETGSDTGNLLARIPGPDGSRTILLCAHLDTVPLAAPIEVQREEGAFSNRNEGILGADNKAAVATILAVARRLVRTGSPVGVELLFTTCEEVALQGAKAFDRNRLRSEFGFVFDHASPIGDLIVAAPSYFRIEGRFRGQAAHAGIRPEEGRSAIKAAAAAVGMLQLGRLDEETTANAGRIEGGTANNVVAERCTLDLECRSLDHDKASARATEMIGALTEAGSLHECDVETIVEQPFRGFRLSRTSPPVLAAAAALEAAGVEPAYVHTGGGSDANVFAQRGLPCLNVANGTERNHEPGERVTVQALELMLDVALGIVERSA